MTDARDGGVSVPPVSGAATGRPPQIARRIDGRVLAGVLVVAALVLTGLGVVWFDTGEAGGDPTLREYPAGDRPPAPRIAGETLDRRHLDVADLRGDVVVVNIWASWCPPCRAETDDLEAVYQATRDQGVSFVGINMRDSRDRAVSFMEGRVTYPSIFDPASEYARHFSDPPPPVGPPATLVIDRAGDVAVVIYRVVGPIELQTVVERVAAEVPAGG
jgi:thiol-disulfide isomerase/thioredoxin